MFFAQIENVPAESLKNFVLIVAGALAAAYYIKEIFFKEKAPQPFDVHIVESLVTKQEFKDHVDFNNVTHSELFGKITAVERNGRQHLDQKLDAMSRSAEAGREKLHDRVNEVLTAVSVLQGKVEEMSRD